MRLLPSRTVATLSIWKRKQMGTPGITVELITMAIQSLLLPSKPERTCTGDLSSRHSRVSLLRRIYDAIIAAQRARAEREIARYLQNSGLKLTDALEREIEHRFSGVKRK
jgi:hypothetical protein